jgi:hypothetical protein
MRFLIYLSTLLILTLAESVFAQEGQWEVLPPIPTIRTEVASTQLNGKFMWQVDLHQQESLTK